MVCVTETWCTANEILLVHVQCYQLAGSFCRSSLKGGGVAILVRQDIVFKSFNKLFHLNDEQHFEFTLCELIISNKSITVGCFYRSPTGNFVYFLITHMSYYLKFAKLYQLLLYVETSM